MLTNEKSFGLSGNVLKIIAAVSMFIDHLGLILFPHVKALRIIGRIAFPIFAFLIAEGAKHTRKRLSYFLHLFVLGGVCVIVQYFATNRLLFNVLISFSLSVLAIFSLQEIKKALVIDQKPLKTALFSLCFITVIAGAYTLDYFCDVDYGFWGVLVAVFAGLFHSVGEENTKILKSLDNKYVSVLLMIIPLLVIMRSWSLQPYSLLSIPLLLLYSGKRGKYKMKYFFYVFYPLHIALLYGIRQFFF